jgi:hypothetical protein
MKCDDVRQQLADYLSGEASREAREPIEQHLAGCAGCNETAAMWSKLGALAEERPSPALRARFDAMLAAYREGAAEQRERSRRPRFTFSGWLETWWPYHPAFQFGIAVACLLAGGVVGLLAAGRAGGGQELAQLREEVHKTRQLVAVSLLQQQSASDRLRGVTWSYRVSQPDQDVLGALLRTVKYDTSVDVRLAAVDALRRYAGEPAVRDGLLEGLNGRQSPLVQIALIDLFVEARERESVRALAKLKDDKDANEAVRERAGWALERLQIQ